MTLAEKIKHIEAAGFNGDKKIELLKEAIAEYEQKYDLIGLVIARKTSLKETATPIFERYKNGKMFIPFRSAPSQDYVDAVNKLDGIVNINYISRDKYKELACPTYANIAGAILSTLIALPFYFAHGDKELLMLGPIPGAVLGSVMTAPLAVVNEEFLQGLKKEITSVDGAIKQVY